jgi:hypothetical protein
VASSRGLIVAAMKSRFQGINTGEGYITDMGNNVFLWKQSDFSPEEYPAVSIKDGDEEVAAHTIRYSKWTLTVELLGAVQSPTDGAKPEDVAELGRQMIEDLVKAIYVDETWGVVNTQTYVKNTGIQVDQENKALAWCYLKLHVIYLTLRTTYDPS